MILQNTSCFNINLLLTLDLKRNPWNNESTDPRLENSAGVFVVAAMIDVKIIIFIS
jgi:hypothetical protein